MTILTKEDHERFVKTWLTSDSVREVAEKLGIKRTAAYNRAAAYRARGVRLPRHSGMIDVAALNRLIEEGAHD